MPQTNSKTEVLIIGSGIAGASAALALSDHGIAVTLINSGTNLINGSSALAQGGIVYRSISESSKNLAEDILIAGHKYNYIKAVNYLCKHGPKAVQSILINRLNIPFNRADASVCQEWDLTREGGHSTKRILHCADHTGISIMEKFISGLQQSKLITLLSQRTAIDLITTHHHSNNLQLRYQLPNRCLGAYILNEATNKVETLLADYTIIATGGIGHLYLHTTNPTSANGSGIAMAHRAGVRIENAEFVQFHPTALYHGQTPLFLISEAMRGEGARLINSLGETFMSRYDPRADLAPRDIVARAIVEEMLRLNNNCVYLDAANYMKNDLVNRFPTIYNNCLNLGIDITKTPIPVVPAAHYFCGGILVDLKGKTSLEHLYAIGECTCTGVHGANRLASTSLLEALLWGKETAFDIYNNYKNKSKKIKALLDTAIPDWIEAKTEFNEDPALIAQDWATIRHTLWNYVGITRSKARLQRACIELNTLSHRITEFYKNSPISKNLVNLFHGCTTASIVAEAARRNKKSLGCHFRID